MRTPRTLIPLLAAGALFLGACSSNGSNDDAKSDGSTTTAAEKADQADDTPVTVDNGSDSPTTEGKGSSGSADEDEYVTAIADSLTSGEADDLKVDQDTADCIAQQMVDDFGVERFQDAGVEPGDVDASDFPTNLDLTVPESESIYDAFTGCDVDMVDLLLDSTGATGAARSCMEDVMTDDAMRDAMAAAFRGEDPDSSFTDDLQACSQEG